MGDREAISRLYDEVADIVQAQYPHARIRGEMYAGGGPTLTIQITPEDAMGLSVGLSAGVMACDGGCR